MDDPMILYHYTCAHGATRVEATRTLRPTPLSWARQDRVLVADGHPPSGLADHPTVAWLTDFDELDDDLARRLGFVNPVAHPGGTTCRRTDYRVTVDTERAVRWHTWAMLRTANPRWRLWLETGRSPEHWWVVDEPVPIVAVEPHRLIVPRSGS
jgi:hypothetical protein